MARFFVIGECWLEIFFRDRRPVNSYPGGEAAHIAEALCRDGRPTLLLTEIGNDSVGEGIAAELREKGIDLEYADMYARRTSLVVRSDSATTRYDLPAPDEEGFDIAYPQVKQDDVVAFGGHLALDRRVRRRLLAFLDYCREVKARLVYIPDVVDSRIPHPTPVMASVLENLELADFVIALPGDLRLLYGSDDPESAYRSGISFYCSAFAALTETAPADCSVASFGSAPTSAHRQKHRIVADLLEAFADAPAPAPAAG